MIFVNKKTGKIWVVRGITQGWYTNFSKVRLYREEERLQRKGITLKQLEKQFEFIGYL